MRSRRSHALERDLTTFLESHGVFQARSKIVGHMYAKHSHGNQPEVGWSTRTQNDPVFRLKIQS